LEWIHLPGGSVSEMGGKPYQCKTCDAVFRHGSGLKHHEMIHSGDKPHLFSFFFSFFKRNGVSLLSHK
jgi:hypothetical protein